MADVGGVNSFRSFARSWQRAVGFAEVIPRRPSFILAHEHPSQEDIQYGRSLVENRPPPPEASLLRQHLQASPPKTATGEHPGESSTGHPSLHDAASASHDFRERESKALDAEIASGALPVAASPSRSSIFAVAPHLATPSIIESYSSYRSSQYGTMGPGLLQPRPFTSHTAGDDGDDMAHGEHDPILVKEVKQGSKVTLTVEGQSTLPQSVFNSINAIIGVGLLSLPLAFKIAGWIFGLVILSLTASVTAYTGDLLAKCMKFDPSLITYSDLAYVSFGTRARIVVSALFTLELVAACVALVILFADSLDLLLPGLAGVNVWKCVCAALVLILNSMPLRWLSYTSVLGIFSTFCSRFLRFSHTAGYMTLTETA